MRRSLPLLVAAALATVAGAEEVKHRILVDKVLMESTGWTMTAEHVAEIAAAGFTAVAPRQGNDDPDDVRRVARWAAAHGLAHLPWSRGTLTAPRLAAGATHPGDRLVWADGTEQDLYAPDSDALWRWLTDRVVGYARVRVDEPALLGVFLDFENYAPGRQGNAYSLSYDRQVLGRFAEDAGVAMPDLAPAQRQPWLEAQGLHDGFETFQVDRWRQRCRRLRAAVDAIDPSFRFCVYPAPGTPFIRRAVWPEWGTAAAPLMLADPSTYGRAGLLPHAEALDANRRTLESRRAESRQQLPNVIYLGGIDPIVPGADPEFCGRNALQIAATADGYWVFYEGPRYDGDHRQYFQWFTWANEAIEAGRWGAWREARATPEPGLKVDVRRATSRPLLGWYGLKPRMVTSLESLGAYEVHRLDFLGIDYLRQFDVVVLQNLNLDLPYEHDYVQSLRAFVEGGGGLLLAHDTAWFLASPVPEVAQRGQPTQNVEAERHVVDADLRLVGALPGISIAPDPFTPEFRDHMIFRPGPLGRVLVENHFGDPVYVTGQLGAGRVVFAGSYYGYERPLSGTENQLFTACLAWLAAQQP